MTARQRDSAVLIGHKTCAGSSPGRASQDTCPPSCQLTRFDEIMQILSCLFQTGVCYTYSILNLGGNVVQINIHENEGRLSELVKQVVAGEEVIIGSAEGEPVAKLIPYAQNDQSSLPPKGNNNGAQQEFIERTDGLFEGIWGKSAEEIDDYIRSERQSWKNRT